MKKITFTLMAATGLFLVTSCGGGGTASEAAEKVCSCMEPMMGLKDRADKAKESGDMEEASSIMSELSTVQGEAMDCVKSLQEEYEGKVSESDLKDALKEECPETAELMFGS